MRYKKLNAAKVGNNLPFSKFRKEMFAEFINKTTKLQHQYSILIKFLAPKAVTSHCSLFSIFASK